ncbi:MAG TPA: YihY/virulence factor BrkB family protein [Trebonia sp.]|jgi:YihY family inner membrane protein|nr:YihY/virulence factor BrkB family protein [Trebonia sp.]
MNWFKRAATAMDRFQSRRPWTAVLVAVWRKSSDDQAGYLAALICYFGFVALFPLLLIFVTVLDATLKSRPELHRDLLKSALMQYPVLGDQINNSLGQVSGTGFRLGIGIAVLVLGTRGVAFAMQHALCQIWEISRPDRPNFFKRSLYGLALVVAIGIGLVVTSFLSGIAGGAGHLLTSFGAYVGAVAISLTLNVGVFWLAFRLATMRMVPWRNLRFGAMLAALVWQVLQVAGGYAVTHSLQRVSTLYGAFGVVLGLLGWLYLQATVTVYCAEVDAVLAKGRWPRSLLSVAGAPPEGSIRPRHSVPAAVADEAVADEAVADVTTPGGTVPAVPVQARSREDTAPMSTVSTSTVPMSTVQAAPPKAGDDGRMATRRDDSRENGAASRDAGKDGARNSESGQGTSSA